MSDPTEPTDPTRPGPTFPGAVRQVGHLVADLEASMADWLSLGVGPWTVIDVSQPDGHHRGRLAPAHTAIGFANIGPLQLELIEALGQADSVWHQARDDGRFGPHHLAFWTDDFDAALVAATRAGLAIAQDGDGNGIARFAYFETPTGSLVEVMELSSLSRAFMDGIRDSCDDWDGVTRPIRR